MSDVLRFWPILRDIIKAIRHSGGDPDTELRRIEQSYRAKGRAEGTWDAAMGEKWGKR